MSIARYDHSAIPVGDADAMLAFYEKLGFTIESFSLDGFDFWAVQAGAVKINFHAPKTWEGNAFSLRAPKAVPGSADFCFVWDGTLQTLTAFLEHAGIPVLTGPVERKGGHQGGTAIGTSIYIRDPDQNLLEFIIYP